MNTIVEGARAFSGRVLNRHAPRRLALGVALHGGLTLASWFTALALRFDLDWSEMANPERCLVAPGLLLAFRLSSAVLGGLIGRTLRYTSAGDVVSVARVYVVSSVLLAASALVLRLSNFPRTVLVTEFCLSLLGYCALGITARLVAERLRGRNIRAEPRREVLVLGAGDSGHLVVRNLLSQMRLAYLPRGILDDSERMTGAAVHGVPVMGTLSALDDTLARFPQVSAVIVAIPSLPESRMGVIRSVCEQRGVLVKRVQSFEDIACHDFSDPPYAPIEEILEKNSRFEYEPEIRRSLAGKRVLVTGAGGSIGSELVRQLLSHGPASLVLVDSSEFNLFKLRGELVESKEALEISPVLADVRELDELGAVFREHRPHIVFHAAAYKHVPILERHAHQAFRNNVVGTSNALTLSPVHGAERFIFISTDKAVEPTSVMGATKRISELLVQEYSRRDDLGPKKVDVAIVRFGNVINSAGSVIPFFKEQILRGGPVTVTHPAVERYFMSLREAVQLVLVAGTLGEGGAVYVLEMGLPVRVVDVARKMLALHGRPDIPVVFTGLRPGEKLSESLTWRHERIEPTRFEKIFRATTDGARAAVGRGVRSFVDSVRERMDSMPPDALRELLLAECAESVAGGNEKGAKEAP